MDMILLQLINSFSLRNRYDQNIIEWQQILETQNDIKDNKEIFQ